MRNKFGILELDLGEITIQTLFDSEGSEDITSSLSEQQKDIIRQAYYGLSKLVYVKCDITDGNGEGFNFKGFGCITNNSIQVVAYSYGLSTWIRVTFSYDNSGDTYNIIL